jgi:hypothetical protein
MSSPVHLHHRFRRGNDLASHKVHPCRLDFPLELPSDSSSARATETDFLAWPLCSRCRPFPNCLLSALCLLTVQDSTFSSNPECHVSRRLGSSCSLLKAGGADVSDAGYVVRNFAQYTASLTYAHGKGSRDQHSPIPCEGRFALLHTCPVLRSHTWVWYGAGRGEFIVVIIPLLPPARIQPSPDFSLPPPTEPYP